MMARVGVELVLRNENLRSGGGWRRAAGIEP